MIFMNTFVWVVGALASVLFAPAAFVLAGLLRLGCLTRVDRWTRFITLRRCLRALVAFDVVHLAIRFTFHLRPTLKPPFDSVAPQVDWFGCGLKVALACFCLSYARRAPAMMIVGFGLLLDAFGAANQLMSGYSYGDMILWEIVAWSVVFFGMGRIGREIRIEEIRENPLPLWMQVAQAPLMARSEEVR